MKINYVIFKPGESIQIWAQSFFRVGPKVQDNVIFLNFAEAFKILSTTNNCWVQTWR